MKLICILIMRSVITLFVTVVHVKSPASKTTTVLPLY